MYVAALDGGSRHPVQDVARQLGQGHNATFVRDAIHRARERGLLTRAPRGKADGELTEKALALLDEASASNT
jgi:hypothetical protein